MDGYLLDANHLFPLLRANDANRTAILKRMATVPSDAPVYVATATLAELELGCFWPHERPQAQTEIRDTIRTNKLTVLDFTNHTASVYGELKAALMRKYNRKGLNRASKVPERWTSPDKGATLGVDEFDLLVVCHALERRLVLVTLDPMLRICQGIGEAANGLGFDNWVPASNVKT